MRLTEKDLQKQIMALLQACNIWVWQTHKIGAFRNRQVKRGVSDFLGVWPPNSGLLLAIECKVGKGKLTQEQEQFLDDVRRHGGTGIVVRSVEDVVAALGLKVRL